MPATSTMTTVPTKRELTDTIADAMRQAVADLFQSHPERFYYCSLITTGEAHAPFLAAWSEASLLKLAVQVRGEHEPAAARAITAAWSWGTDCMVVPRCLRRSNESTRASDSGGLAQARGSLCGVWVACLPEPTGCAIAEAWRRAKLQC